MHYSPTTNGFYLPELHGDAIPPDAVEITAEAHVALMTAQSQGAVIQPDANGNPVAVFPDPPTAAEVLTSAKAAAHAAVEAAVSAIRHAFVTDLPGQEMIYLAKEAEARAWQAATDPDLADYPFLQAEVGLTAATPAALATLWLSMAGQWRAVAAQIEAARMTATAAIGAATTPAEAEAAVAALQEALAGVLAA
jgi:hypothetical protein